MARHRRRRRSRRITLALLALALLLSVGAWLGLRARDALQARGCLPLPQDVVAAPLPLADPQRVRFAALGDAGTGKPLQRQVAETLVRTCGERGCDFVLMLGDNVYPHGLTSVADPAFDAKVEALYAPLHTPVYAVLGNHDVKGDALAQVYRSLGSSVWRMPNTRYGFRAGPLRVFAINTNCGLPALDGLRTDLSATDAAPWTLVAGHHTLRSIGAKAEEWWAQRWYWDALLADRVDFYLSGHEHLLAQIGGEEHPTDFFISGGGGEVYPEQNPAPDAAGVAPLALPFVHTQGGFVWFEVTPDLARWVFIDAAGTVLHAAERRRPQQGEAP